MKAMMKFIIPPPIKDKVIQKDWNLALKYIYLVGVNVITFRFHGNHYGLISMDYK